MSWTWDDINVGWLRDSPELEPRPEWWVDDFSTLERYFGSAWVEQSRFENGIESWGIEPAAYLASQGRRLAILDCVGGASRLIEKLRRRDSGAWAELTAIWLLRHDDPEVQVELEPSIEGWAKLPDFRVRRSKVPWTYVEVTQPRVSAEQHRLRAIMTRLSTLVGETPGRYSLEVSLNRAPSDDELQYLIGRMPDLCRLEGKQVEVLPGDLGSLFLNETQAGRVELRGRDEVYRPRLGMARTIVENGIPQRHIAVRLAYADQRADAFLRQEASQLPKTAPGLVMIQTSGTTGGFRQWAPILSSRLRPRQHTRVGAIVLFQSGMMPDEHGIEAWHPEAKWISNPYAAVQLPDWIPQNLERHYE